MVVPNWAAQREGVVKVEINSSTQAEIHTVDRVLKEMELRPLPFGTGHRRSENTDSSR